MSPDATNARQWSVKALTPIWTGDAESRGDRLINTGLLGSVHWWLELLVRGLGGTACDQSNAGNRCPDKAGKRCVVCELFGCTGWARKFRFQVVDTNGKTLSSASQRNTAFRLRFVPMRLIAANEWALLDRTLRLIADYGAIGGKTVWKPTDEQARANAQHHPDYGLIELTGDLQRLDRSVIERYVKRDTWRKVDDSDFSWASLTNLWCVNGRYLARQNGNASAFNRVLGRNEAKNQAQQLSGSNATTQWVAGRQQESKKVFSFKEPARTFGFVKPGTIGFAQMQERLKGAWDDLKDAEVLTGSVIIDRLFNESARAAE